MKINHKDFKICCSEFFATLLLIIFSCCGNATCKDNASIMNSRIVKILLMRAFGFLFGGHANPNITLTCSLLGFLTRRMTIQYIVCQFLGVVVGYTASALIIPREYFLNYYEPVYYVKINENVNMTYIWAIEFLFTSIFILAWLGFIDSRNEYIFNYVNVRFAAIILIQILGDLATDVSMNLATLWATAIFYKNYRYLPVYMSAQLLAIPFAVLLFCCFNKERNYDELFAEYEKIKEEHTRKMNIERRYAEIRRRYMKQATRK